MWVKACIFDLDGVIVDTAKYHFLAWKRLAGGMGINFSERDNERLKGVSRMASLEIILSIGGVAAGEHEKEKMAATKNEWYVDYISHMTPDEILPGTSEFIAALKAVGIKIALGSASRNTPLILERVGLTKVFDAVADGNIVQRAKPDPEVFLKAAEMVGANPGDCVVFEDAVAGVEAARNAGMKCVGIGDPGILQKADIVIRGLHEMTIDKLKLLENR